MGCLGRCEAPFKPLCSSVQEQICSFGQIPSQLLRNPHPLRHVSKSPAGPSTPTTATVARALSDVTATAPQSRTPTDITSLGLDMRDSKPSFLPYEGDGIAALLTAACPGLPVSHVLVVSITGHVCVCACPVFLRPKSKESGGLTLEVAEKTSLPTGMAWSKYAVPEWSLPAGATLSQSQAYDPYHAEVCCLEWAVRSQCRLRLRRAAVAGGLLHYPPVPGPKPKAMPPAAPVAEQSDIGEDCCRLHLPALLP